MEPQRSIFSNFWREKTAWRLITLGQKFNYFVSDEVSTQKKNGVWPIKHSENMFLNDGIYFHLRACEILNYCTITWYLWKNFVGIIFAQWGKEPEFYFSSWCFHLSKNFYLKNIQKNSRVSSKNHFITRGCSIENHPRMKNIEALFKLGQWIINDTIFSLSSLGRATDEIMHTKLFLHLERCANFRSNFIPKRWRTEKIIFLHPPLP